MNITLVNKTDSVGGAAVACYRLLNALKSIGANAKLLVQEKQKNDESVISTSSTRLKKQINFLRFVFERICFLFHERSKEIRFAFSLANTGENISQNKLIKTADIIHIHWFNQGFLSLSGLKKLTRLNKPIVWTLHDMWAFTGGCHYAGECSNYKTQCANCNFLKKPSSSDLSTKIFNSKKHVYTDANITFITCSKWLAEKAKESSLLKTFRIESIPNPIDTKVFYPYDKIIARKELNLPENKLLILFASANIMDKRKGFSYFADALNILKTKFQHTDEIELVLFGKANHDIQTLLSFKTNQLPYLTDMYKIAKVYAAANLFVLPSLEDNLPNTIMEALACGTPVAAFDTGGIPEMIEHQKNGYLAAYKSSESLAEAVHWCLFEANQSELSINARIKVENEYSNEVVANKYLSIYHSVKK